MGHRQLNHAVEGDLHEDRDDIQGSYQHRQYEGEDRSIMPAVGLIVPESLGRGDIVLIPIEVYRVIFQN